MKLKKLREGKEQIGTRKSRYAEEQAIGAVKQMEAGRKAKELARELGVSEATLYAWKWKYGGLEVNEARAAARSGAGECAIEEAGRRLVVGQGCPADGDPKKRVELVEQRRDVALVMAEHGLSERQACKLLELDRTPCRYEPRPDRNAGLRAALIELAPQKPRYGYRRLGALLVRRGWPANPKRVWRLCRQEQLAVRRLKRKRVERMAPPAAMLRAANQEWAIDFVMDSLATGRSFRALTIIDSFTRECPAIEVGICLGSQRVTRVLDRVIAERGRPQAIRCDNGPEAALGHFSTLCERQQIRLVFIDPGRLMRKTQVESFHERSRDECLNADYFLTLPGAKAMIESRTTEFNSERPHTSLAYLAPEEFPAEQMPRGDSTGLVSGQGDSNAIPSPPLIPAAREGSMTRQDAGEASGYDWQKRRVRIKVISTISKSVFQRRARVEAFVESCQNRL